MHAGNTHLRLMSGVFPGDTVVSGGGFGVQELEGCTWQRLLTPLLLLPLPIIKAIAAGPREESSKKATLRLSLHVHHY